MVGGVSEAREPLPGRMSTKEGPLTKVLMHRDSGDNGRGLKKSLAGFDWGG